MAHKKAKNKDKLVSKLSEIERTVADLRGQMLERVPEHFSKKDVINSFLGAMFMGLTFILKLDIVQIAIRLDSYRIILLVLSTFLVLTAEIYFVAYLRVPNKKQRTFGQFWAKRFVSLYLVTVLVSLFLVYIYGIDNFVATSDDVFKVVVAVTMPCAVGAAVPSLLRKY